MKKRSVLIVLAHPDDESFPIGGTIAKYAAEGVRFTLVCATRGEHGIEGMDPFTTAQVRENELRHACAVLGIEDIRFLGHIDGELNKADEVSVLDQLHSILNELRPQVVVSFGPDGISGHPDHVAISALTTRAFDKAKTANRLLYIAPSEATRQGCGVTPSKEIAGGPIISIDISKYRVTKVKAAQCHHSQNPPFSGQPEVEAARLACHELFVLARTERPLKDSNDLFSGIVP